MPFTFSHPALVIPLSRPGIGLSLTGLVMGSMVPDFEFILRMKVAENIGHGWVGLVVFDIPVAIVLCFVFHLHVRDLLIHHLPAWYRVRFGPAIQFNWSTYAFDNKLKVLISIVIGILSHFFWDAFTHYDGAFVSLIPGLHSDVVIIQHHVPVYSILQVVSSLWGLWVVQQLITRLPVQPESAPVRSPLYWPAVALLTLVIFYSRFIALPEYRSFWNLFFAGMGSVTYALLGVSALRRIRIWQRSTEPVQ